MRTLCYAASLLVTPIAASAEPQQPPIPDRSHEGDWYIADTTDNNTGEREVYAFQTIFEPEFVTMKMRCSKGKPVVFVEWSDVVIPDHAVLTIGPIDEPEIGVAGEGYAFTKSENPVESGFKATAESSSKIVSASGGAKFASITVHAGAGPRSVAMDVDGTLRAWSRVTRHCPIRQLPRPPL